MKYRPTKRTFRNATNRTMIVARWAWTPASVPTRQEISVATISPIQTTLIGLRARVLSWAAIELVQEVEQREQDDPQEVDHVPEARAALHERELALGQLLLAGEHEQRRQHAHADQQMEGVDPGEHEE